MDFSSSCPSHRDARKSNVNAHRMHSGEGNSSPRRPDSSQTPSLAQRFTFFNDFLTTIIFVNSFFKGTGEPNRQQQQRECISIPQVLSSSRLFEFIHFPILVCVLISLRRIFVLIFFFGFFLAYTQLNMERLFLLMLRRIPNFGSCAFLGS